MAAKPMLVENLDNPEVLCALTNAACAKLPPPKSKRRKAAESIRFYMEHARKRLTTAKNVVQ